MIVGSTQRRTVKIVKIRRRGRHASPSQVERVAAQAGKAAPAVVMASALVAAPALASSGTSAGAAAQGAHHTTRLTANGTAGAVQSAATATLDSFSSSADKSATARTYVVRSGDTLSAIAQRFYHNAADWQWVYHENDKTVANPNRIYVGERLSIPLSAPAHYTLPYQPRHAKPVTTTVSASTGAKSGRTSYSGRIGVTDWESGDSRTHPTAIHHPAPSRGTTTDTSSSSSSSGWVPPSGTYSCSALEILWDAAGGNPGSAFMAAEIARAESGGNPNAISPTDDYGLWQINASNGALATLDPFKNAKSAIILSDDGRNWAPWTTYTSGAYAGRC
ncbi:MAG TPA: transglycosylase SLT domain-containing protein [Trebonia sp.]|jgi:LysM repeat protein|nr:transglycosylase SLT domain-containing protein [Trebonia sp.]